MQFPPTELPTVFLLTDRNQAFTVPFQGDPTKPCVLIFSSVAIAEEVRLRIAPSAAQNKAVDLDAEAKEFLRRLWLWDVDYFCVIDGTDDAAPVTVGKLSDLFAGA